MISEIFQLYFPALLTKILWLLRSVRINESITEEKDICQKNILIENIILGISILDKKNQTLGPAECPYEISRFIITHVSSNSYMR